MALAMRLQELPSLNWWLRTDAGMIARIAIGIAIFAFFAVTDLAKHGRRATRWREYLFLMVGVAAACAYGATNDLITSRLSWEYFYYGKGLSDVLGPATPPDRTQLAVAAVKVGMQATWSAGLIAAAALLIANNPRPGQPRLSYKRLFVHLASIASIAIPIAVVAGIIGYLNGLAWISADLAAIARDNIFRPRWFMCVYGIHLGGYIGAAVGVLWSIGRVMKKRQRLAAQMAIAGSV